MLLINKTLIKMSKGIRGWIAVITGLKILTLVGTVMFARTLSNFLGDLYNPVLTKDDLIGAVISAFLASILILIADLLTGEAQYRLEAKARIQLRKQIFEKMLLLDVGKIEQIGASNTISSVGDGVESMQIYYTKYLPSLLYCFFAPVYLFFQLKDTSLLVASILLIISLALPLLNNYFRQTIDKLKKSYWTSFQALTSYYLESLKGLVTLKLFNQDKRRHENLKEKADNFNSNTMSIMKINFVSFLVSDGLIYLGIVIAAIIACMQLKEQKIDLSKAVLILMLSYSFFSSIRQLMSAAHDALAGIAATSNVDEILAIDTKRKQLSSFESDQEILKRYDQKVLDTLHNYPGIIFKDVDFSYHSKRKILTHLNLEIPKGKTTAIVGRSGCGKSTLASMLMRFIDPKQGYLYFEGVCYYNNMPNELRKKIIMVPQKVNIFSGSLEDNLKIAKEDASTSELLEVLKQVHLYDWVKSLPEGLSTNLGDSGAILSGGQKQKIGIARALLSGAPYIIFDEATSSVDQNSEDEIWNCINELSHTRTLIIISHRLSTIQKADQIIVLNQGVLVEQGNHEKLLKKKGEYYQLVKEQEILESHGKQRLNYES
ncbi:ABC transporter ATP-binding protein/permease [Thomasclavelia sp.]